MPKFKFRHAFIFVFYFLYFLSIIVPLIANTINVAVTTIITTNTIVVICCFDIPAFGIPPFIVVESVISPSLLPGMFSGAFTF